MPTLGTVVAVQAAGLIPDATHLWWDLRLHPLYGTLEFRIADAQTRVAEAGAVAAVCQALVAALAARFDAGEKLTVHETERIAENRWAGVRDGLAGVLADLDTGGPMAARTRIGFLLAAVEPAAEALGSRNELLAAWTLLAENGAGRQRRVVARTGLDGLVRRLADDTEQGPAGESSSCACDGRAR